MPKKKTITAAPNGDAILNASLTMSLIKKLVEKGFFSNEDAALIIRDALHGASKIESPFSFVAQNGADFFRDCTADRLLALPHTNKEPI